MKRSAIAMSSRRLPGKQVVEKQISLTRTGADTIGQILKSTGRPCVTKSEQGPKEKKKEKSAEKREKLHRDAMMAEKATSGSFLVVNSVQPRTLKDYRRRLAVFADWIKPLKLDKLDAVTLGRVIIEHWEELFMNGSAAGEAEKLLSAVELLVKDARRGQIREPVNARLALRGFRRLCPAATRAPMPWVGLCAMIGASLWAGEVDFALAILLAFVAYLRPGELVSLTSEQLIEPLPGSGVTWWSVLIAPEIKGKPSKIGAFDETALLDQPILLRLAPVLRKQKRRAEKGNLWPFTQLQYGATFKRMAEFSGTAVLAAHPYSLRHGGASHDSLHKLRTPEQIRKQGRWRCEKSVARYNKHARVVAEANKLPEKVRRYGQLVNQNLVAWMAKPAMAKPPPPQALLRN